MPEFSTLQHSSADDLVYIRFVARVWDRLLPDQFLYAGSPASFRSRWSALLRHLRVPPSFSLTPGSLRGGGAVASHRRGVPIADLMWKMRISQQRTLFHYLQEVTAISMLPQLSERTRTDIKLLQGFLPCSCRSFNPAAHTVQQ